MQNKNGNNIQYYSLKNLYVGNCMIRMEQFNSKILGNIIVINRFISLEIVKVEDIFPFSSTIANITSTNSIIDFLIHEFEEFVIISWITSEAKLVIAVLKNGSGFKILASETLPIDIEVFEKFYILEIEKEFKFFKFFITTRYNHCLWTKVTNSSGSRSIFKNINTMPKGEILSKSISNGKMKEIITLNLTANLKKAHIRRWQLDTSGNIQLLNEFNPKFIPEKLFIYHDDYLMGAFEDKFFIINVKSLETQVYNHNICCVFPHLKDLILFDNKGTSYHAQLNCLDLSIKNLTFTEILEGESSLSNMTDCIFIPEKSLFICYKFDCSGILIKYSENFQDRLSFFEFDSECPILSLLSLNNQLYALTGRDQNSSIRLLKEGYRSYVKSIADISLRGLINFWPVKRLRSDTFHHFLLLGFAHGTSLLRINKQNEIEDVSEIFTIETDSVTLSIASSLNGSFLVQVCSNKIAAMKLTDSKEKFLLHLEDTFIHAIIKNDYIFCANNLAIVIFKIVSSATNIFIEKFYRLDLQNFHILLDSLSFDDDLFLIIVYNFTNTLTFKITDKFISAIKNDITFSELNERDTFLNQINLWNSKGKMFLLCSFNNGKLLVFHLIYHKDNNIIFLEKIFDQIISSLPLSFVDGIQNNELLMIFNRETSYKIEMIFEEGIETQQKLIPKLSKLYLSADKIAIIKLNSGQETYLVLNGGVLEMVQIHLRSQAWLDRVLIVPFAKKFKLDHTGKQMIISKVSPIKHDPSIIIYRDFTMIASFSTPLHLKIKDFIVLNDQLLLVSFSSLLECSENKSNGNDDDPITTPVTKIIGEIVLYKISLKKSNMTFSLKRISGLSFPYEITHIQYISEQYKIAFYYHL